MPFQEVIAVYCENHMKLCVKNAALMTVRADGTYSYRLELKG
jgi:hypothetical protein